jgi:hypothetical protein
VQAVVRETLDEICRLTLLWVAALCAIAAASIKAQAQGKLEAATALTGWSEALGNVEKTVAMYTKDAVRVGTTRPIISYSEEGVNKDFTCVAARFEAQVKFGQMSGRKLAGNAVSFTGFYDFTLTRKKGETSVFPARFAFVVVKVDSRSITLRRDRRRRSNNRRLCLA